MKDNNLALWHSVERTDPKYTKKAKVGGLEITTIAPQYQIMNVTEQFGEYGKTWGFKDIELDYSLVNIPHTIDVMQGKYPNQTKVGERQSILGLVVFKATFFYPGGEFPIINSINLFTDNARTKIDDNFAKKVETDALTKAVSKLGFNADIFLGKFDDVRYMNDNSAFFYFKPIIDSIVTEVDITALYQANLQAFQNNNELMDYLKQKTELIRKEATNGK